MYRKQSHLSALIRPGLLDRRPPLPGRRPRPLPGVGETGVVRAGHVHAQGLELPLQPGKRGSVKLYQHGTCQ